MSFKLTLSDHSRADYDHPTPTAKPHGSPRHRGLVSFQHKTVNADNFASHLHHNTTRPVLCTSVSLSRHINIVDCVEKSVGGNELQGVPEERYSSKLEARDLRKARTLIFPRLLKRLNRNSTLESPRKMQSSLMLNGALTSLKGRRKSYTMSPRSTSMPLMAC